MNQPVLCQLDHLVVSPKGLFGFGWAVPRQSRITQAWLELWFADESTRRVAVSIERPRRTWQPPFPTTPLQPRPVSCSSPAGLGSDR